MTARAGGRGVGGGVGGRAGVQSLAGRLVYEKFFFKQEGVN